MADDQGNDSEPNQRQRTSKSSKPAMPMMRIAIAGTGGLARLIAHYIREETGHHVVFLSRSQQPRLTDGGYQVAIVNYADIETLKFALRGIDTVISTVTGPNQIELIKAAVTVRVRRFAPAEFEGLPRFRSVNDVLDRNRTVAQQWLSYYAQHIQSTTFVCGILYERFQPYGLRESAIGLTSGFSGEGDYIMNCRTMQAEVPAYDANRLPNVTICMTAAQDVGRFVTKALDLPEWPRELRMCGQRVAVRDLVVAVQHLKGQIFNPINYHDPQSLSATLQVAIAQQDHHRAIKIHTLLATAAGRYDFIDCNLNRAFPNVRPMSFHDWFIAKWNLQS